jgi:hypothetical protein
MGVSTRTACRATSAGDAESVAAGRVDGGSFHLGVAPAALVGLLLLVRAGPWLLALDNRFRRVFSTD